ncbi:MAG: hypothetical protein JXA20_12905 [Spirochaetes bacterium]|nr:hypothetical protein [Spirochaetota bacterium]
MTADTAVSASRSWFIATLTLHGTANILNRIFDLRKGLDREPTPVGGAILRGLTPPERAFRDAAALLFAAIGRFA